MPSWWARAIFGRRPRATLIRILVLVLVTFVLFKWFLFPVRVTGISMEPTLHNGQIKLVNRAAFRKSEPHRGDIVSIGEIGRPGYMKRIVALPGETWAIRDGYVYIDGTLLDEPYVVHRAPWQRAPSTLSPEEYLVIGDNRGMDQRSHTYGPTERRFIIGKLLF